MPDLTFPLADPVQAQLLNTDSGLCLEGHFTESEIIRNDPGKGLFKGKYIAP